MRSVILVAISLVVCVGCASDVANRYYGDQHFPPKPVDQVELLSQTPTRPFDVIADFQSRGDSPASIRKKAADIGADAVIVRILGGYSSESEEWAQQRENHDPNDHIVGTAIKYREEHK